MTELRRRMDDDMLARGFADRTRESYLWAVTGSAMVEPGEPRVERESAALPQRGACLR